MRKQLHIDAVDLGSGLALLAGLGMLVVAVMSVSLIFTAVAVVLVLAAVVLRIASVGLERSAAPKAAPQPQPAVEHPRWTSEEESTSLQEVASQAAGW